MRNLTALTIAPDAALLAVVAKHLALARGGKETTSQYAEALETATRVNAPARVQSYLKALVETGGTHNAALDGMIDTQIIVTAFVSSLRNRSLFYGLLDDGMVKVPLRTRLSSVTADATAFIVGEGAAVPMSKMGIKGQTLEVHHAAGLIALTDEMIRSTGSVGEAVISRELRRVVTAIVDAKFLDEIVDGDTPTYASEGPDAADALMDLRRLLAAVKPTTESRPLFALAPDVARGAATLTGLTGTLMFPEMSPTGGRILNTDAMVSDQLEAGTIMLIDGAGIVGNSDTITVEASYEATLELADNPTGDTVDVTGGATSTLVSMWQTNSVAIMARVFFGVERIRDNAVAVVTGAGWGDPAEVGS